MLSILKMVCAEKRSLEYVMQLGELCISTPLICRLSCWKPCLPCWKHRLLHRWSKWTGCRLAFLSNLWQMPCREAMTLRGAADGRFRTLAWWNQWAGSNGSMSGGTGLLARGCVGVSTPEWRYLFSVMIRNLWYTKLKENLRGRRWVADLNSLNRVPVGVLCQQFYTKKSSWKHFDGEYISYMFMMALGSGKGQPSFRLCSKGLKYCMKW